MSSTIEDVTYQYVLKKILTSVKDYGFLTRTERQNKNTDFVSSADSEQGEGSEAVCINQVILKSAMLQEQLEGLVYAPEVGIWPVTLERAFGLEYEKPKASQTKEVLSAHKETGLKALAQEMRKRLESSVVFILKPQVSSNTQAIFKDGYSFTKSNKKEVLFYEYYFEKGLDSTVIQAILTPKVLEPLVKEIFKATPIYSVKTTLTKKEILFPEFERIKYYPNRNDRVSVKFPGPDYVEGFKSFLQDNEKTKSFAVHVIRLPTLVDLNTGLKDKFAFSAESKLTKEEQLLTVAALKADPFKIVSEVILKFEKKHNRKPTTEEITNLVLERKAEIEAKNKMQAWCSGKISYSLNGRIAKACDYEKEELQIVQECMKKAILENLKKEKAESLLEKDPLQAVTKIQMIKKNVPCRKGLNTASADQRIKEETKKRIEAETLRQNNATTERKRKEEDKKRIEAERIRQEKQEKAAICIQRSYRKSKTRLLTKETHQAFLTYFKTKKQTEANCSRAELRFKLAEESYKQEKEKYEQALKEKGSLNLQKVLLLKKYTV